MYNVKRRFDNVIYFSRDKSECWMLDFVRFSLVEFVSSFKGRTEAKRNGKTWTNACKCRVNGTLQFAYLSRCQNRWQYRPTESKDTKSLTLPRIALLLCIRAQCCSEEKKDNGVWAARQPLNIKQFHSNDKSASL
mgnify:CR=1 FL=1